MNTTINDVLNFIETADANHRALIFEALRTETRVNRNVQSAMTLAALKDGDTVTFLYDRVNYVGTVEDINRTTATVRLTEINGIPRRRVAVGDRLKVGATLLKKKV